VTARKRNISPVLLECGEDENACPIMIAFFVEKYNTNTTILRGSLICATPPHPISSSYINTSPSNSFQRKFIAEEIKKTS